MSIPSEMFKYRFDDSGTNAANKIVDETRVVPASNVMPLPLKEGLFYTDSIVVVKEGETNPLISGTDYTFEGIDPEVTAMVGQEVAGAINMTDQDWSGNLKVTYQCVGGPEGMAGSLIRDLLEAIDKASNDTTVLWQSIVGRPQRFTPSVHTHELSSLTELEKLSQALDDVTNAIVSREPMRGSGQTFQQQIDRILRVQAQMRNSLNKLAAARRDTTQIESLQKSIDNFESLVDSELQAELGHWTIIGKWSLDKVTTVRGGISFKTAVDSHALEFIVTGVKNKEPSFTFMADIFTDAPLIDLDAVIAGNELQVRVKPKATGKLKSKWQYAI